MSIVVLLLCLAVAAAAGDLEKARDTQDRAALDKLAAQAAAEAQKKPNDAAAQYKLALADSYLAEIAIEQRDKNQARTVSEAGIKVAERVIALKSDVAEYHRLYGTLCGQAVYSLNLLQAMKYGHCAQDEVNKALQLDPKAAMNYIGHGVGNYYLPAQLGGGAEAARKAFQKSLDLNPTRVWTKQQLEKTPAQ